MNKLSSSDYEEFICRKLTNAAITVSFKKLDTISTPSILRYIQYQMSKKSIKTSEKLWKEIDKYLKSYKK